MSQKTPDSNKNESFSVVQILKDVLPFFIVSLILLIPIVGVKLAGWKYVLRFDLLTAIILALVGLRLLLSISKYIPALNHFLIKYFSQKTYLPEVRGKKKRVNLFLSIGFLVVVSILPFFVDQYLLSIFITAGIYIILSLGLNIVIGFAGLLDLGYVAFYAVGAYTVALLFKYFGLGFWVGLPVAALMAAFFGILLGFPVLRMHGDYLAIVTLGFGEIIRLVMNNWLAFTNGPNGIRLVKPYITFFGLPFKDDNNPLSFHNFFGIDFSERHKAMFIYFCILVVVAITYFICSKLQSLPLGRSWEAIREDEIASRSLGINHVTIKLAAFSMGAFFGGIGGSFFAAFTEFISPTSFTFIESALIVAIVVLGGLGSVPGVVVAAIVMTLLPEFLRDIAQFRILLFGIIMVVMMVWRPRGLTRVIRPKFDKI